jgi:hypothetical protein
LLTNAILGVNKEQARVDYGRRGFLHAAYQESQHVNGIDNANLIPDGGVSAHEGLVKP